MKLPLLENLLYYKHPVVIKRFQKNHPLHAAQAEDLFEQLLKYLWLCRKYEQDKHLHPNDQELQFKPLIHEEMQPIDWMWHEFILITQDYERFCQEYFGVFIHHIPQEMLIEDNSSEQDLIDQLNLFLTYIATQLGEETLMKWFHEHFN